jgi:hypothetical protein
MWTPLTLPQDPQFWGNWDDIENSGQGLSLSGVVEVVPEPAVVSLLAGGFAGLGLRRRRVQCRDSLGRAAE